MTVILTEDEIKEAIEEWAERRAMDFEDLDVKIQHSPTGNAGTYKYEAVVKDVEMPVIQGIKQGPYR